MHWTHEPRDLYRFFAVRTEGSAMARIRTSHVLCAWVLIGLLFQPAAQAQEEKLGDVNFPISCSASAQTQFNRAVAMLHSFFFPETMKAFTAITRQEPSCAMAYWGVAINQRPNPLVAPFPAELMRNGWEADRSGTRGRRKDAAREGLDRGAGCLLQGLRQDRFAHPHAGLRSSDGAVDHKLSGRQ